MYLRSFFLLFGFRRLAKLFHNRCVFFLFGWRYLSFSETRFHTLAENPSEKYLKFINIYVSNWGVPYAAAGAKIQIERRDTQKVFWQNVVLARPRPQR